MTLEETHALFAPFYADFHHLAALSLSERPLLLAHYTSLEVLEKIIKTNEVWFSNPLFMNDLQELRFGVKKGRQIIDEILREPAIIAAIGGDKRVGLISDGFKNSFSNFDRQLALDVYVFCLTEHDPSKHPDGLLSMWRGYGANGHGAALIFNTSFLAFQAGSPLLIAKVFYVTEQQRVDWLQKMFRRCVDVVKDNNITDADLHAVGHQMFYLMLIYSLVSKHPGFVEEQEWRIVYLPDQDREGLLKGQYSYVLAANSIAPRLRFPIEPLHIEPRQTWSFNSILDSILLGPMHSSSLAEFAVKRMFEVLKKPEFIPKLRKSDIPLRPT